MLVGKLERDNIKNLFIIRMRECKTVYRMLMVMVILFLVNILNLFQRLNIYHIQTEQIELTVFSTYSMFFSLIACAYYTYQYREYNENHQIYPQSRMGQFISYELYCYFTLFIMQAAALILYFLQYLLCLGLNYRYGNIAFAFEFSPVFILSGFLVYTLYGILIISIIILSGALSRRYGWRFILLAWVACILTALSIRYGLYIKVTRIFTEEASLIRYYGKMTAICLIFIVLSHLVSKRTMPVWAPKRYASFSMFSILVILIYGISMLSFTTQSDVSTQSMPQSSDYNNPFSEKNLAYTFDTEILTQGTDIQLDYRHDIVNSYTVRHDTGDTEGRLLIYFIPEQNINDWVDLTVFSNPRLEAIIKEDTIYLDVLYDENINVIFLSPYSSLQQFKYLKDGNYAKPVGSSMWSRRPGTIQILVPRDTEVIYK